MSITGSPARARVATLVVVGTPERMSEAVESLRAVEEAGGVRSVFISIGTEAAGAIEQRGDAIAIHGLRPEYLNNAIAGLRLSNLPTVIWWRGGPAERLHGTASLADRVVLDAEDPVPLWRHAVRLFERSGITDLRWTRLTRWRALMARFFDLEEVRQAAPTFDRLVLAGADRSQGALFSGWLAASLGWGDRIVPEFLADGASGPLTRVELTGEAASLRLELLPNGTCVSTEARVHDQVLASRVAPLGDQRIPALLAQELRVRSRDLAFERAIVASLPPSPDAPLPDAALPEM